MTVIMANVSKPLDMYVSWKATGYSKMEKVPDLRLLL